MLKTWKEGQKVSGMFGGHVPYSTGFIAKSQRGKDVEGVVCSSFLKGSTIRVK